MTILELKEQYQIILNKGAKLEEYLAFEKELISNDNDDYLDFHFYIIGNREKENLYFYLRACFKNRKNKEKISEYLIKKYKEGINDNVLKADVIQILGNIKNPYIKSIVQQEIISPIRDIRYRCIIVLGWIGNSKELPLLNERMVNDPDEELREFGATAMRQIWFNHKNTSDEITKYINNAIRNENSEKALIGMIITLQDLHRKKFGIKESQEGDISGDVIAAKAKAIKYLDTIFK